MLRIINYIYTFVSHAEKALIFVEIGQFVRFSSDFRYMETMKDRIRKIMELESSTPSRFAESIGIQRAAMSHILSGRNNPSLDVMTKILERYTYVNPDWLLFGKGDMKRVSTSNDASNSPQENSIFEGNPEDDSVYREENGDKMAVSGNKSTVVEKVIIQEKPSKTINKIMVFYSDNTFDTFVLEKEKKE